MMRRACLVLSTILFLLLGAGCSNLAYTPLPTPYPVDYIPTIIALTVEAGQQALITPSQVVIPQDTLFPSSTPSGQLRITASSSNPTKLPIITTPTASLAPSATYTPDLRASPTRRPTRTPTITPTPIIPRAGVQISLPGPMSKVVSPLELAANLRSMPSGSYHTEIWMEPLQPGGDPRLLYREVKKVIANPIEWIYLEQVIPFELSRVSEFGQLRIGMYDQYGRPVSVSSVDVILLSMGSSDITPTGDVEDPIVIREPTPNHLIQGGVVIVSGLAKPSEEFMLAELVSTDGTVVGYQQVFLTPTPDGSYVPFAFEVPYQVSKGTWVRLEISESGVRIPGIEHLSSVEVYLSP
jgi:hypothetical protein